MRSKFGRRKRWLLVPIVVAAVGSGVAYASIPDSQGVIHTCLKNGTLTAIDTATSSCGKATELDWYSRQASDATFLSSAPGSVGSANLADGAVTTAKVAARPAARLSSSQVQGVPTSTGFGLKYDTTDFISGDVGVERTLSYTCLEAPVDGVYQIDAGVAWDGNGTGVRYLELNVDPAGTMPQRRIADSELPAADGDHFTAQTVSALDHLHAGDCALATVFQDSGSTLDANVTPGATFLSMAWTAP